VVRNGIQYTMILPEKKVKKILSVSCFSVTKFVSLSIIRNQLNNLKNKGYDPII